MKKTALILTAIVSVASISAGKAYWNDKIESQTAAAYQKQIVSTPVEESSKKIQQELTLNATKNLPRQAAEAFIKAENEGKPVKLVLFGSDTSNGEKNSWADQFQQKLKDQYPSSILQIQTIFLKDKTSKEVLSEKLYSKVVEAKPDLLLLEPFILEDNGVVGIDRTLENITVLRNRIQSANKDCIIMIQPSYPLYDAKYYPKEVEALQNYSKENGLAYLNHWENWPAGDSEDLLSYLNQDETGPSPKGQKAWADYLAKVFVGK